MIISFIFQGLNPGIDFTGGRNYVVRFDQNIRTDEVRTAIAEEFGGNPEVKTLVEMTKLESLQITKLMRTM